MVVGLINGNKIVLYRFAILEIVIEILIKRRRKAMKKRTRVVVAGAFINQSFFDQATAESAAREKSRLLRAMRRYRYRILFYFNFHLYLGNYCETIHDSLLFTLTSSITLRANGTSTLYKSFKSASNNNCPIVNCTHAGKEHTNESVHS